MSKTLNEQFADWQQAQARVPKLEDAFLAGAAAKQEAVLGIVREYIGAERKADEKWSEGYEDGMEDTATEIERRIRQCGRRRRKEKAMAKTKVKLTPPDRKRCQAEIRVTPGARAEVIEGLEPHGPIGVFMMGPQAASRIYRCENASAVIAKEARRAADGERGSMSLCESCKAKMVKQCGADFAIFQSIPVKRGKQ